MGYRKPARIALFSVLALACAAGARAEDLLWRDPGPVEQLDLYWGPGGRDHAPAPPFRFDKEDTSGTSAKINVLDANGRHWNVKVGDETRSECFGARVMWAAGYFIEPAYFVRDGQILGIKKLSRRARAHFGSDGRFKDARFQLRDPSIKFLDNYNWAWTNNPFLGTHELAGLKLLIILVSNWDNKDARNAEQGINTAIFEEPGPQPRRIYTFTDWGRSMGGWGYTSNRESWDCGVFSSETPDFVSVVNGEIRWGYVGRHRDFKRDISAADISWLLQYIGRLSDEQIRAGLNGSGATPAEAECFTRELRRRIGMLQQLAVAGPAASR